MTKPVTDSIARGVIRSKAGDHGSMAELLALAGAGLPLLKPAPTADESGMGAAPFAVVTDAHGNKLVSGGRYLLGGEPAMVLCEEHGGTHIMDHFMKVFYLDGNFRRRMACVEPAGRAIGGEYRSRFVPASDT